MALRSAYDGGSMVVLRSLTHLLLALSFAPVFLTHGAVVPFTNCVDVLKLSPEQAKENHPARIRGVVTSYVPSSQLCFVQDETGGVYVFPSPWPKDLAIGSVVDVEGVTGQGRFSSILQWGRIRPTGQTRGVAAKRIAIEELNTGRYDCQLVELEGVVQSVKMEGNVANLEIFTGGSSAIVLLFDKPNAATNWVDARVKLRGVAGTFYSDTELTGFGVFVSNSSDVEIVHPAEEPFERPLRNAGRLAWFSPEGAVDHRVRLKGVVTLSWPGEAFFLQDKSGTVRIEAGHLNEAPNAGDEVEVSGFAREATEPTPYLANSLRRKVGRGTVPEAQLVALSDLVYAPAKGTSVSTEARVIGSHTNSGFTVMIVESGGQLGRMFWSKRLEEDLDGAKIRARGIWSAAPLQLETDQSAGIWVAETNGLTLLERAPAKTGTQGNSKAALAAGVGTLLMGGFLAWQGRRSSKRAAAADRSAKEQFGALTKELEQMKAARERLGRDLHDHIIQSIYAVGLNLEDCRQVLTEPGKAEARLRTALGDINEVIRELRNVILGLETNAIQPQEFRTALKSLGLTLGDEKSSRIRLDIDQQAVDLLSTVQATELVHVAREAMSNSVRHGKALTTTFRLHLQPDGIQFAIEDDGTGFHVEKTDAKGYGLRNMAKRAEALGAKFTVQSQKGAGTRILLDIPNQKQHFSNSESRSRINR